MAKINMVDDVWTCILCQSDTQVLYEILKKWPRLFVG
jgi:hypothetical protein